MKGKMANFAQLESFFIKRILKAILKIKPLGCFCCLYCILWTWFSSFRCVILALPHCHFSFVKFYSEVNVYGKYCSLQRWQENHEALKFKRSCLRGKGTSYSIMLFLKKSTTKDPRYLSEMITAVYTDRRQKQIWHFNLNIQNGWSCGTCLPVLKLFLFFLWKLVTV